jgi:hypothetical protein
LVAAGHHGRTDRIQRFCCQACGHTFSARCGTALAHLKTPPARSGEVLAALAEGLTAGAAVRVFGHREATITRWRDRAAAQAERLHRHFLHDLHLPYVQLDEVRVRLRRRTRVTWRWLALDPATKRIPACELGPRTQQTAYGLVHALCATLAPGCTPVVTTDGLRHYSYALLPTSAAGSLPAGAGAGKSVPPSSMARSSSATAGAASYASNITCVAVPAVPSRRPCACSAGPASCKPPSSNAST